MGNERRKFILFSIDEQGGGRYIFDNNFSNCQNRRRCIIITVGVEIRRCLMGRDHKSEVGRIAVSFYRL